MRARWQATRQSFNSASGSAAPRVLVAGLFDWWSTYRTIRVIALAGARVEALSDPSFIYRRSRFVSRGFDAPREPVAFAAVLERHLAAERYDWVVIADDLSFAFLGSQPNPWWVRPWFPVAPGSRAFSFATSKVAFALIAREQGLPVPPFTPVERIDHALEAARSFGFPVVGKTSSIGFGGAAVALIDGERALREWWARSQGDRIVQQFMRGRYATTEMLYDRGRLRAYVSSLRSNFWPGGLGASTTRTLVDPPGILHILESIGSLTAFDGLCGIDWIWADDGTPYLSELNPRPTPGYVLRPDVTEALAAAVRERLAGVPLQVHAVTSPSRALHQFPESITFAAERGARAWANAAASLRRAPWDEPGILFAQWRTAARLAREVREARAKMTQNGPG